MKKYIVVSVAIIFIIFAVALFTGAFSSINFMSKDNTVFESVNFRVNVILPSIKQDYWLSVVNGIEQNVSEDISISFYESENIDINSQLESLEMAIAAQVDGIIVQVPDDEYFKQALSRATISGIPVVVIDGQTEPGQFYVGSDNYEIGRLAGEAMAKTSNSNAKVAIISQNANSFSQNQRIEGFVDALNSHENMSITSIEYTNENIIEATITAEDVLKTHPETNAMFGVTGISTSGIAKMMETKANKSTYDVVGIDAMSDTLLGIEQNYIYGTVEQSPEQIGSAAISILNEILVELEYPQNQYHYTEVTLITEAETLEARGEQ